MLRAIASWLRGMRSAKSHLLIRRARLLLELLEDRCTPSTFPSPNWSGYVAEPNNPKSQPVSAVSGTWVVPKVAGVTGAVPNLSSIWIGIDGTDGYLEQIGTEQNSSGSDYAWLEFFKPGQTQSQSPMLFPVKPGNSISASIKYQGTTNGRESFFFSITDNTTRQTWAHSEVLGAAPRASAEWVVEATSYVFNGQAGVVQLLPNFGTATFSAASATIGGVSGKINNPAWQNYALNINLENWNCVTLVLSPGPNTQEDSTSPLTSSGGFSVAYDPQPFDVSGSNVYELQRGNLWCYESTNGWTEIDTGVQSFAIASDGMVVELNADGYLKVQTVADSASWILLGNSTQSMAIAGNGMVVELERSVNLLDAIQDYYQIVLLLAHHVQG